MSARPATFSLLAVLLLACHSSSDQGAAPGPAPGAAPSPPAQAGRPFSTNQCSMTLSGPVEGTFECSLEANVFNQQNVINVSAPKAGIVSATIKLPQGIKAGSWTNHDAAMDATASMLKLPIGQWGATKQMKGSEVSLSIASASPDPKVPSVMRVSGSIEATLPNGNNVHAPPLKMHITF